MTLANPPESAYIAGTCRLCSDFRAPPIAPLACNRGATLNQV
jgi:hypothetical protein